MKETLPLNQKDAAAVQEFTERVRAKLGEKLVALRLFGSKATGRDVAESDIDILLVIDAPSIVAEDEVLDIAFAVNVAHDVYISPRVIPKQVLEDPVWKITPFLRNVTMEGIPL